MNRLFGIQYLRGLAATAVVLFHAAQRAGTHFTVGEAGVDLFFVLSGFLMVSITSPESGPCGFLYDRAVRIVPAYWIATGTFLLGALIGAFPNARLETWHVVSSFLFLPSRVPGGMEIWPLLVPGWTLNFEMFFYLLFACSLLVPRPWQLPLLTAVLVPLALVGMVWHPQGAAAAFYTQPILLEFVAGAWLGAAWKRHGAGTGAWPQIAVAAAAALYLFAWWVDDDGLRVALYGVPAMLLFVGVLGLEQRRAVPHWPLLERLGNASYSIYLWHTMILAVTTKAAGKLHLPLAATLVLGVVASLTGGLIARHVIERPIERFFKRRKTRLGVPIPNM